MMEIKQSTAARDLVFYMVNTSDGYTPITGLSPTVTLSKNGGSFASPAGAVTEISGGFYKVAANATDSNTLGILALKATGSSAVPVAMAFSVVANIQSDAISSISALNNITAAAAATAVRTELATELSRIDATVSSRNATTPPTAAAIADAVWDEATSGHTTAGTTGKALTDLEAGGAATPAEIADAVWDETLAAHATAGSAGAGLAAASASGNPWETVLPGAYATGTAGAAIGRLNLTPEAGPVVVIPDPSSDAGQCVLFIDTRSFNGTVAPGLQIRVTPIGGPARTAGGRVVGLEERLMTTDAEGRATMTVERTDLVMPAGSITYQINAPTFRLNAIIAPTTDTFNLAELIPS